MVARLRPMWGKIGRLVALLSVVAWMETGCVAVLSEPVRLVADRTVSLAQVRITPEVYLGRTIIVGGDILRLWHVPGTTFLEVLHKPLDSADRPLLTDRSEGRFIVRCDRYLDPATYAAGRVVTMAGRVLGTHTDKVGEVDYVYPLLACVEIYLWPPAPAVVEVYPPAWLWWEWDPWYCGTRGTGGIPSLAALAALASSSQVSCLRRPASVATQPVSTADHARPRHWGAPWRGHLVTPQDTFGTGDAVQSHTPSTTSWSGLG